MRGAALRRLSIILVLGIVMVWVCLCAQPAQGEVGTYERYDTLPFQAGALVIPMDAGQGDILSAFGMVHALLRNGTKIHRIITPPGVRISTELVPDGREFTGGPFVVPEANLSLVSDVRSTFPDVTLDSTLELFVSSKVYTIQGPTRILLIKPWNEYSRHGHTEILLDRMRIPYTIMTTLQVDVFPDLMLDYDLIIDDDMGWDGALKEATLQMMRAAVFGGKHIIYTDKALKDAGVAFPGMATIVIGQQGAFECTFVPHAESPAQYDGPATLTVVSSRMHDDPRVIRRPVSSKVRVLLECEDYAGEHRILAAYFYYGKGSVEYLAYHPEDQEGVSYVLTSIFYGNRFVQAPPAPLKPPLPPAPDSSELPLPAALPPPPPPPPPPPGLPVATTIPAQYLFAGFAGLILADRLRSKVRPKIALRQKQVVSA